MLTSIDPKIPSALSKLKNAAVFVALCLSGFSLITGVLYWTYGAGDADIAAGVFAGALPEVMVVLFFVSLDLMWKQKQKGSGTFAGIAVVTIALIVSWLASSAGSFMYLASLDERAIASSQSEVSSTREAALNADLARYKTELQAYEGVKREDVGALEDLLKRCPNVPRDECVTTEIQARLATNKAINDLETKQANTLAAIEALAGVEQQGIREGQFSMALLASKLDLQSREFLLIAYMDTLKIILFFVGLWASLRIRLLADVQREEQIDLKRELDDRYEAILAVQADVDAKLADLSEQTLQVVKLASRAEKSAGKLQDAVKAGKGVIAPKNRENATTGKPRREKTAKSGDGDTDFVEYEIQGENGETITKRMKIA